MTTIKRVRVSVETMIARSAEALAAKGKAGFVCLRCGSKMGIDTTDPITGGVRRYRVCRHCGYRKTTFER